MELRPIHFSIYESSLLAKAGIPVYDMYQAMLDFHKDQPEVVALFTDLKKDWDQPPSENTASSYRMVGPFYERKTLDNDFLVGACFAELGAITTDVGKYWSDMAMAFLLKRKIHAQEPTTEDVEVGKYLLGSSEPHQVLEIEMLSWSENPEWKHIPERNVSALPESWWTTFKSDAVPTTPLLSRDTLKENLTRAGTPERLAELEHLWNQYTTAYLTLKDSSGS